MSKPRKYYSSHVFTMGIAKFTYLDKPQDGFKPGDKPKYKLRCLLDDTEAVRAEIDAVIERALQEAKEDGIKIKRGYSTPFEYPEDQDPDDYEVQEGKEYAVLDEDHKGRIFFEAKSAFAPELIDTLRQSLPEGVKIMGGDKVRVKVEARPYDGFGGGVTFRLVTVQLVEKNTSAGGGSFRTDGFDYIEGGYVASPQTEGGEGPEDDDEPF